MSEFLFIQTVERRDNEVIYWVGVNGKPRDFGVVFDQNIVNSARGEVVESILLSLGVTGRIIDSLGPQQPGGTA